MTGRRSDASRPGGNVHRDGPIAKALFELQFSRITGYQSLALELGGVLLDMPQDALSRNGVDCGPLFRHSDRFPAGRLVMWWIEKVAEENLLAGAVLLDAIDLVVDMLRPTLPDRIVFPGPQDKTDWTQRIGPYVVEFVVPEGWEFVFGGVAHPAGFRGVAGVDRCHLSQCSGHYDEGAGRLVGLGRRSSNSAVGFDIPCLYLSGVQVVDDKLDGTKTAPYHGRCASIPYAFIVRAFRRPRSLDSPLAFISRPTDEEVVEMARRALTRM